MDLSISSVTHYTDAEPRLPTLLWANRVRSCQHVVRRDQSSGEWEDEVSETPLVEQTNNIAAGYKAGHRTNSGGRRLGRRRPGSGLTRRVGRERWREGTDAQVEYLLVLGLARRGARHPALPAIESPRCTDKNRANHHRRTVISL